MAASLIWLVVYLAAGALVLWACYKSPACRLAGRIERNERISRMFSVSGMPPAGPPAVAPERVPASK